ncbi:MAG: hypothetical protein U0271_47785 [Polyangiaceae bacterium]
MSNGVRYVLGHFNGADAPKRTRGLGRALAAEAPKLDVQLVCLDALAGPLAGLEPLPAK